MANPLYTFLTTAGKNKLMSLTPSGPSIRISRFVPMYDWRIDSIARGMEDTAVDTLFATIKTDEQARVLPFGEYLWKPSNYNSGYDFDTPEYELSRDDSDYVISSDGVVVSGITDEVLSGDSKEISLSQQLSTKNFINRKIDGAGYSPMSPSYHTAGSISSSGTTLTTSGTFTEYNTASINSDFDDTFAFSASKQGSGFGDDSIINASDNITDAYKARMFSNVQYTPIDDYNENGYSGESVGNFVCSLSENIGSCKINKIALFGTMVDSAGDEVANSTVYIGCVYFKQPIIKSIDGDGYDEFTIDVIVSFTGIDEADIHKIYHSEASLIAPVALNTVGSVKFIHAGHKEGFDFGYTGAWRYLRGSSDDYRDAELALFKSHIYADDTTTTPRANVSEIGFDINDTVQTLPFASGYATSSSLDGVEARISSKWVDIFKLPGAEFILPNTNTYTSFGTANYRFKTAYIDEIITRTIAYSKESGGYYPDYNIKVMNGLIPNTLPIDGKTGVFSPAADVDVDEYSIPSIGSSTHKWYRGYFKELISTTLTTNYITGIDGPSYIKELLRVTGSFIPTATDTYSLGGSVAPVAGADYRWLGVYAKTFYGDDLSVSVEGSIVSIRTQCMNALDWDYDDSNTAGYEVLINGSLVPGSKKGSTDGDTYTLGVAPDEDSTHNRNAWNAGYIKNIYTRNIRACETYLNSELEDDVVVGSSVGESAKRFEHIYAEHINSEHINAEHINGVNADELIGSVGYHGAQIGNFAQFQNVNLKGISGGESSSSVAATIWYTALSDLAGSEPTFRMCNLHIRHASDLQVNATTGDGTFKIKMSDDTAFPFEPIESDRDTIIQLPAARTNGKSIPALLKFDRATNSLKLYTFNGTTYTTSGLVGDVYPGFYSVSLDLSFMVSVA